MFLVTGKSSFESILAVSNLSKILSHYKTVRFCDFSVNPHVEDIEKGRVLLNQSDCDVTLAIGGGSVLDMAKSVNLLAGQEGSVLDYLSNKKSISPCKRPLIAVPTTAGSGSEATSFAVVYVEKIKYSLSHQFMLPDEVILDAALTLSLTPYITASTGMDALSQAIESYWSIHATAESSAYAIEAILLILKNLVAAVNHPTPTSREALLYAAHLAGKAINISKTTAAHALSYPITVHFGIPHGHAVGLTLPRFLIYNSLVDAEDVADLRGIDYVQQRMNELYRLFAVNNAVDTAKQIELLMQNIGLETDMTILGIKTEADRNLILQQVNAERMKNNPRVVTTTALYQLLITPTLSYAHSEYQ